MTKDIGDASVVFMRMQKGGKIVCAVCLCVNDMYAHKSGTCCGSHGARGGCRVRTSLGFFNLPALLLFLIVAFPVFNADSKSQQTIRDRDHDRDHDVPNLQLAVTCPAALILLGRAQNWVCVCVCVCVCVMCVLVCVWVWACVCAITSS